MGYSLVLQRDTANIKAVLRDVHINLRIFLFFLDFSQISAVSTVCPPSFKILNPHCRGIKKNGYILTLVCDVSSTSSHGMTEQQLINPTICQGGDLHYPLFFKEIFR